MIHILYVGIDLIRGERFWSVDRGCVIMFVPLTGPDDIAYASLLSA